MNEIFQRTLQARTEDNHSWSKIDMVTPDGAYDAVGNLVNVGDTVKLCIDGKTEIDKVTQIEDLDYQGRIGIATENHGWSFFWGVLKI